jgi:multiple sugar transport system ATP-binding protein
MASLSLEKISKAFGRTQVLGEISFDVADGEFCVLLGPSGCGKSTLLRIVAGLEDASSGKVRIGAESVERTPPRDRDVAFVFQNYALYPHMTVAENLGFSLRLHGVAINDIQARVADTAQLLEIDNLLGHKPQQLSGGQRQRVALGRAIVRRPKLFLFDEPLSNLDATLRATMRVEIAKLHERLGATMLYVTHDQAEAMTLGDSIVVLNQGTVQQRGTPAEIYHQPANAFVAGFVGNPRMNLIDGAVDAGGTRFTSHGLTIDFSRLVAAQDATTFRGQDLTLGIRPEHLTPAQGDDAIVAGTVALVEDLGADRFVHVDCNGVNLIWRSSGQESFRRGDGLSLTASPDRFHVFHQGARQNLAHDRKSF